MANMSDDIEWIVSGDSAVSGTYRDKAKVGQFWAAITEKSFTTRPSDSWATTSSSCLPASRTHQPRTARD